MKSIGANLCLIALLGFTQPSLAGPPAHTGPVASKAEKLEQKVAAAGTAVSLPASETITETEAQTADPDGVEPLDNAFICLARTIYWETKGEDDAGMQAIASVVMNRLGHDGFPQTVCAVVQQGQEQGSCEFSWWCDGRSDDVEEEEPYERAKEIARQALNGELHDTTDGALYFHHRGVNPYWSDDYTRLTEVGGHIFYKPADGKAR
jgi:spore germination cell wall hydrolase CwlJ-like protein